jgi:hypothetical protein
MKQKRKRKSKKKEDQPEKVKEYEEIMKALDKLRQMI